MNVIRVMGGLGNQLYVYAFGQTLMACGMEVGFDTTCYRTHPRPYLLDRFDTHVQQQPFLKQTVLKQSSYHDVKPIRNVNFWGYWQALRYCELSLPLMREQIWVKKEYYTPEFVKLREQVGCSNSLALHVRRTDGEILPLEYYMKALRIAKAVRDVHKVYVFSDDMDWCRENFTDVEFVHMECYLDFELIRLCKYAIIPNSTFSYWGALLNDNPDKLVIIANRLKWSTPPVKWKDGDAAWFEQVAVEMEDQIPKDWLVC